MQQVVVIHGGDSFPDREAFKTWLKSFTVSLDDFLPHARWSANLPKDLGKNFQVLLPRMPNSYNCHYDEWEIWFEKMIPFLKDGVVLVGHSQGGIFLAKYLSERPFPVHIGMLIVVAAPYSTTDYIGDFALTKSLAPVEKKCGEIHLFQSADDPIVQPEEVKAYQAAWPAARVHLMKDRGHFRQEHFPELVDVIKGLVSVN